MNEEDKNKIIRNLTVLRERIMVSIHPILLKLIENGIFKLEFNAQFHTITDRDRQFSEFVSALTSSGHPQSYSTFKEALRTEGFDDLVDTMDKTVADPNRTLHSKVDGAVAAGGSSEGSFGAMYEMFAEAERRHEERLKSIVEEVMAKEMKDMAKDVSHMRQKQTEAELLLSDIREKQTETELLLSDIGQKQTVAELLRQEDQKYLHELHELNTRTVEILQHSSDEMKCLKEDYKRLQEVQKGMRHTDNDRLLRLREKNFEIEDLNCKIKETEKKLDAKEAEIGQLKKTVCGQYEQIRSILGKQRQTRKVQTVSKQVNQAIEIYQKTGVIDLNFQVNLGD